jgi:hypothetical protein
MNQSARELLRRKLSPKTFGNIRFGWWYYRSHLGGFAATFSGHPAPVIHSFPEGMAFRMPGEISGVKTFAPTTMCRVMARHGSDKGTNHNYTTIYSVLFRQLRTKPLRIFELGLGTNNPNLASSMGVYGKPGASMRGWRELFPRARIYGADIDRDILFTDDRIETFYCDQLDADAIRSLWSQPSLREEMDIIIDDGLHTMEGNVSFMNGSLEHLRPGGVYVVEDILSNTVNDWLNLLRSGYPERFQGYEFTLAKIPHPYNRHDNNLLIVRRRA